MPVTSGPVVRPARVADADAIGEIHVASWQAAYAGQLPGDYLAGLSVADRQRGWQRRLERPPAGNDVLVVEVGHTVAGFCSIGPSRDESAARDTAELYAIYLHPRHSGGGLGRALHDHAIATLLAGGYLSATLWVLDSNARARGFYERLGWHAEGKTKIETVGDTVQLREIRYQRELSTISAG